MGEQVQQFSQQDEGSHYSRSLSSCSRLRPGAKGRGIPTVSFRRNAPERRQECGSQEKEKGKRKEAEGCWQGKRKEAEGCWQGKRKEARPSRTSASSLTLLDPSETVPAPSRRPRARLESVDLELEQGLLEQQLNQPETSED